MKENEKFTSKKQNKLFSLILSSSLSLSDYLLKFDHDSNEDCF